MSHTKKPVKAANALAEASARRSSLFDVQRIQQDRGSSIISLSGNQSLARRVPRILYENTFKMEPDQKMDMQKVTEIITNTLAEKMTGVKYNALEAGHLCKRTAQAVKEEVKFLEIDRYKIVCTVTIAQNDGQSERLASRFLWDDKKDNWTDVTFFGPNFTANAAVYALYYE